LTGTAVPLLPFQVTAIFLRSLFDLVSSNCNAIYSLIVIWIPSRSYPNLVLAYSFDYDRKSP
jgi:hypothetical protein